MLRVPRCSPARARLSLAREPGPPRAAAGPDACGRRRGAGAGRGRGGSRRGIFHPPNRPFTASSPTPPAPPHPPRASSPLERSHMLSGCCHRDRSGDKEMGGGRGVRVPEPPPDPQRSLETMGRGARPRRGLATMPAPLPRQSFLSYVNACGRARFGCGSCTGPRKGGVAPHTELAAMPGRAAAGTMPARVTLTSHRRPTPPGATAVGPHLPASPRYLPAPLRPWGSAGSGAGVRPCQHPPCAGSGCVPCCRAGMAPSARAQCQPVPGTGPSSGMVGDVGWEGVPGGSPPPAPLWEGGAGASGSAAPIPGLLPGAAAFGHKSRKRCRGTSQPHRGE